MHLHIFPRHVGDGFALVCTGILTEAQARRIERDAGRIKNALGVPEGQMFIEPRVPRSLKLQGADYLASLRGTLRSSGAKEIFLAAMSYKHWPLCGRETSTRCRIA